MLLSKHKEQADRPRKCEGKITNEQVLNKVHWKLTVFINGREMQTSSRNPEELQPMKHDL